MQAEGFQAEGFAPAALIETSPGNYQTWIKLSDQPLPAEALKRIEKALAMKWVGVEQKKRLEALKTAFTGTFTHADPLQEYRRRLARA